MVVTELFLLDKRIDILLITRMSHFRTLENIRKLLEIEDSRFRRCTDIVVAALPTPLEQA